MSGVPCSFSSDTKYLQVKSGGHAYAAGHSSTLGVMISMKNFDNITVNDDDTITLGVGLTWDQVYAQITPQGITVAGGRVAGVG